jgi:hypothetical protein
LRGISFCIEPTNSIAQVLVGREIRTDATEERLDKEANL